LKKRRDKKVLTFSRRIILEIVRYGTSLKVDYDWWKCYLRNFSEHNAKISA